MKTMNRRGFIRMVGAWGKAAGLSLLVQACARVGIQIPPVETPLPPTNTVSPTDVVSPSQTPEPANLATATSPSPATPTPTSPDISRVALVKTTDRGEGVRRALELLGADPVQGKRVFLKPNYNSADPTPGSTHADVLRTLGAWLKEKAAQSITVGDRSGMGDTRQVFQQRQVFDIAQELGMDVVVFDELGAEDSVKFEPAGSHWQRGFLIPRICLEADAIVQTCCVKTHQYGGHFTLSLKNSVGLAAKYDPLDGYNYMSELHSSADQRKMIAEINAVYRPALIVMDGVEAFVSGGPATGKKVQPGVMLAGVDRVAMDAVGVAILRYFGATPQVMQGRVFELEQIARAVALRLGVDSPEKISFVTGDEVSAGFAEELRQLLLA